MIVASLLLNIAVLVFFIVACATFYKEQSRDRAVRKRELRFALRYFTVQSNILAFFVCVIVVICDLMILYGALPAVPLAVVVLKMISTAAVMLTFFVVLFYLLPKFGMTDLFQGANFYMHLVIPLLCFFSLVFCEGVYKIPILFFLLTLIPVAAYSVLYVYNVVFRPEEKGRWYDFYLFNEHGKWYLIILLMLVITAVIGLLLAALINL